MRCKSLIRGGTGVAHAIGLFDPLPHYGGGPRQRLRYPVFQRVLLRHRQFVAGRGIEGDRYFSGTGTYLSAGFHINLGGKLPPGQFTLLAEMIVNGNAMNAQVERVPVVVSPHP